MVFSVMGKKINFGKTFFSFKIFNKFKRKSKVVNFGPLSAGVESQVSKDRITCKSVDDIPGPQPDLPLIGTSWICSPIGPYSKDQALTTVREDFLSKYGPIYKERLGGASIVSLHDPKHIELAMRNQGKYPMRMVNDANIFWRRSRPDLYKSIGLVDSVGEDWNSVRAKSAPPMLKPQLLKPYTEMFSSLADDFIQVVKSEGESRAVGEALDVRPLLYRYTLEAIWNATLGLKIGTLKLKPTEEASNLIHHSMSLFDAFATLSCSRHSWKLWPHAARLCPVTTFSKFCSSEETVFRIVSKHTKKKMKEIQEEPKSENIDKSSILRRFLSTDNFDLKDINTIIVDFIVAGIPTTSYFLCLLLHRLGKEDRVQARLQEELDQVLGGKDVVITEDHLHYLPYLKAVMKEGFRLTSIIPGIMRLLPDDIVCDKYLIPANTPILLQLRAACKSSTYFSSPEEFIPERHLQTADSEEIKQLQKEIRENRFLILPFGFGPRMCIGKRLSERETITLLAKIFLNFNIRTTGDLELSNHFIIGPKSTVPIEFIARQ